MAIQNFEGHGAPGVTIVGEVGDIYTDLDTGKVYQCSMVYRYAASQSLDGVTHEYVWKEKDEKLAYSEMVEVTKTFNVALVGSYSAPVIPYFKLIEGVTYSTTIDGNYYEAVAEIDENNGGAVTVFFLREEDANHLGDNFSLAYMEELGFTAITYSVYDNENDDYYESRPETITLTYIDEVVHPIDPKFLPAMPLFVSLVGEEGDNGTNYYCTVPFRDILTALKNKRMVVANYTYMNLAENIVFSVNQILASQTSIRFYTSDGEYMLSDDDILTLYES